MTEAQIKALKCKRGAAKRSLTMFENFLKRFNPEVDFPVLSKRFSELEKTREIFLEYQNDLELLEGEEDEQKLTEIHQHKVDFEEAYFEAYKIAHKLLFPGPTSPAQTSSSVAATPTSDPSIVSVNLNQSSAIINPGLPGDHGQISNQTPESVASLTGEQISMQSQTRESAFPSSNEQIPQQNQTRESFPPHSEHPVITAPNYYNTSYLGLPSVELPKFGGAFDEWIGFHDLFESFIHGDKNIPPIRKLYHLKSCLVGEAASVISSIEASAQNYELAWNLLKDRYDNRKLMREKYIQAILDISQISREFSTQSFVDHLQKNLRALKTLGEPIDGWNSILVVILRNKLPNSLRDRWEEHSNSSPNPTIDQFINFLARRAQFEATRAQASSWKPDSQKSNARAPSQPKQAFSLEVSPGRCLHCSDDNHYISSCNKFTVLTPFARYEIAKKKGWCTNCLRNTHQSSQCTASKCRICGQRHNTLLHFEKFNNSSQKTNRNNYNNNNYNNSNHSNHNNHTSSNNNNTTSQSESSAQAQTSRVNLHALVSSEALLATAIVDIVNPQGISKACRVFLDAGSQAHFITEATANFLRLDRTEVNISVSGVDDLSTNIKHATRAIIKSRFNKFSKNVEFLIIPHISKAMPSAPIDIAGLEIPKNIVLADPEFCKPSSVDALIGVNLFYKLLSVGQIKLKNHPEAILQKTQLGWVVAGGLNPSFKKPNLSCHLIFNNQANDTNLTRFWEIEELPAAKILSPEEQLCEEHFLRNTTRDSTGRYTVRLPFNNNVSKLGTSYSSALRRFQSLEKRLVQDKEIGNEYTNFLQEYIDLGHMSLATESNAEDSGFYLPHHAVVKKDSLTTKTRVVFDGSAKTSSGISLNDALMVGPKLQDDLFILLIRYRSHTIVLTADIEKMYRQIQVHPDDTKYQKILFRSNPSKPMSTFILNTVTYGTTCASHLAIRALQQLANDEGHAYPHAAVALKRDFYVDDLLTGANTIPEAEVLRNELNEILKKGGFNLRKWASNEPSLLYNCDEHPVTTHMSLDPDTAIKTLGIHWNAREDNIFYSVNACKPKAVTKRSILSQIAKLFDPLGLLGPVILHAKIIMQSLWKTGLAWDESVPVDLHTSWAAYVEQLPLISALRFGRCITIPEPINVQMHGFCDASEKAYGACLYLRSVAQDGHIHVRLICSKSRVAPVSSISLPRLELCGALLLARLFHTVKQALLINIDEIFLWSDSTIALHWLNTPPHRLKTFVSNRVAEIQRLTSVCHWRHVASLDNPADLVSRGQLPSEFVQGQLWQQGPSWLWKEQILWPKTILTHIDLPDLKPDTSTATCMKLELRGYDLIERYESFERATRLVAHLLRFINNLRCKEPQRIRDHLTPAEMNAARNTIIKLVQMVSFATEINCLRKGIPIRDGSKLIPLNPFLDPNGILRVGGRLAWSELPEGQRHPILLPSDHHITRTIIREEHVRLNHAGTQATLYSLRQVYWPLNSRNTTRKIIHKCLKCFRAKPKLADHVMGDLPSYRVSQSRPFLHVGVDYCGPLYMKERRHRNRQKLKVYVAVYVCMSTKAVHLELVTDLTTEAFIASLKRFFARRGKSTDIYSDNGTNFVGNSRELNELYTLLHSTEHKTTMQHYMLQQKINWHFIPPRAPHFGGLWEAAVKSFKKHFVRTVGDTPLTYDQLETYIVEIEAILNSRPISPLSSDPNDILPLTPGHFLIGGPLTTFPQVDFTDTKSNRLSAWQHAQQMKQHFWQRWYKEYLHQLIMRPSHCQRSSNLEVGTLVLISEDNLPPLQWPVGRVITVHPGRDGVVRAATIKTAKGEYERCTKKLCPLPFEDDSTAHQD
ncbi:uncharacterized protein LOC130677020 [Microplitis mediator]|uniref:uncharacterized protein LOC130677020 n=1 Tax=Microplitis mediator TaxID=375433 RepID=UPI00255638DF|nr:uncharacterized protein LOC130677020 [Microplitis mediator]